jgi:hypothetical protein
MLNLIIMKNAYNETKPTPEIRDKSKALLIIISSWLREIEMPLHPINYIIHLEGKTKLINLRGLHLQQRYTRTAKVYQVRINII